MFLKKNGYRIYDFVAILNKQNYNEEKVKLF
jgi:hypothetical protein